jgi:hypothetical protein
MLLSALAEGHLPLEAASYIADALIMSDDFDFADEGVRRTVLPLRPERTALTA